MQVNQNVAIPAGVGVVSLGVGFVAGYMFHKKRLEREMDQTEEALAEFLEKSGEQLRADFEKLSGQSDEEGDFVMVNPYEKDDSEEKEEPEVLIPAQVIELVPTEELAEDQRVSIFVDEDPEWNYELELSNRRQDQPYIIHVDEFFDSENDHRQIQLIWYEGDEVLCDDQQVPIFNVADTVGELKFGHGSKDQNVVYVRNVKNDAEYEITKDPGHYATEVLGIQAEEAYESSDLQHMHSPRKFRE